MCPPQPVSYGAGLLRRLGTRFNQTQTATGRLAMDELNMQVREAGPTLECRGSFGRLPTAAAGAGAVSGAARLHLACMLIRDAISSWSLRWCTCREGPGPLHVFMWQLRQICLMQAALLSTVVGGVIQKVAGKAYVDHCNGVMKNEEACILSAGRISPSCCGCCFLSACLPEKC